MPSVKQRPFSSPAINITHAAERVAAELTVRDDLTNGNGILQGASMRTRRQPGILPWPTCRPASSQPRSKARPISSPPALGETAHALQPVPLHRGRTTGLGGHASRAVTAGLPRS